MDKGVLGIYVGSFSLLMLVVSVFFAEGALFRFYALSDNLGSTEGEVLTVQEDMILSGTPNTCEVWYSYSVDGDTYTNNRVALEEKVYYHECKGKIDSGMSINVKYVLGMPAFSIGYFGLYPGSNDPIWVFFASLVLFLLSFIVLIRLLLKK